MKPTIRDVAKKAGVSPATVSLVLNNRSGISRETRTIVLAAVETLGYIITKRASSQETREVICFLKIVRHGHILNRDHNEFISDYIEGIQKEAQVSGMSLEVRNYSSTEIPDIISDLEGTPYKGLIVLATELAPSDMEGFNTLALPVVFIDASHPMLPFDFVDMDNEGAVYSLVKAFIDHGHTKIGMIAATTETKNFTLRKRYFLEAMHYFDLPVEDQWIFSSDSTREQAYHDIRPQIEALKDHLPTALFCVCDIIAYGALRALVDTESTVPKDISIIGFDNLISSQITSPPLSSVNVSKRCIGSKAFQLVQRRIDKQEELPYEKVFIGSTLIQRESLSFITKEKH